MDYSDLERLRRKYMKLFFDGEYDKIPPAELQLCKEKWARFCRDERLAREAAIKFANESVPF